MKSSIAVMSIFFMISCHAQVALKDPGEIKNEAILEAIVKKVSQVLESPSVESKIKDLLVTGVGELNLIDNEKIMLRKILTAVKLFVTDKWLFDMLELGSERDVEKVANKLNISVAVLKEYDEEEKALFERFKRGELSPVGFKEMVKEIEKKPKYAPIISVRTDFKNAMMFGMALINEINLGNKQTKDFILMSLQEILDALQ